MQPGPGYQYQDQSSPEAIEKNRVRFTGLLHDFGSSKSFLISILLLTLGNLVTLVYSFTVSPYLFAYSFILTILPITGFWLIYSASKSPRLPERSLTAIKFFKSSVIITLIIECILVLALIILSIALFLGAFATGAFMNGGTAQIIMNVIGVTLLITAAIVLVFTILYLRSVLRLLNGIRDGLSGKPVFSLPGIKFFTVFTCIMLGFALLSSLSTLSTLSTYTGDMYASTLSTLSDLPDEFATIFEPFLTNTGFIYVISLISGIAANIGTLLYIIGLNRFNKSLRYNP